VYKHEKKECVRNSGAFQEVAIRKEWRMYLSFDFDKTLRCFSPDLTDEDGILDHLIKQLTSAALTEEFGSHLVQ